MSATSPADDDVCVGRVGPTRGIRGDLFVEPRTDVPAERFVPGAVLRTDPADRGPLTVESANLAGGKLVVHFAGVDDRPGAEALRGTQLLMRSSDRPALDDPDEFYDTDLVGLRARTVDGAELGAVAEVVHAAGASYLLVPVDGHDRLIPFVSAIVPEVDLGAGIVVVDPPDGLFDL